MSIKASEQGIEIIRQARRDQKWNREDPRWLIQVSKFLDPNSSRNWDSYLNKDIQYLETNVSHIALISMPTWKRFLQGKAVQNDNFNACCKALKLLPVAVAENYNWKPSYGINRESKIVSNLTSYMYGKRDYQKAYSILIDSLPILMNSAEFCVSDDARQGLESAELISRHLLQKVPGKTNLYLCLADLQHSLGNYQKALSYYRKFYSQSFEGESTLRAIIYAAAMNIMLGNYEEATKELENSLLYNQPEIQNQCRHYQSWIAIHQGQFKEAAAILHKNFENFQFFDSAISISGDYHFLGRAYYEMSNFEAAIEMLKKQYDILEKKPDRLGSIAHCFRWMSQCYMKLGNRDQANFYLYASQNNFEQSQACLDKGEMAHIYLQKGKLDLREKNLDIAKENLLQALNIWQKVQYRRGISNCYYALGIACEKQLKWQDSIHYYLKAKAIFKHTRNPDYYKTLSALNRIEKTTGKTIY